MRKTEVEECRDVRIVYVCAHAHANACMRNWRGWYCICIRVYAYVCMYLYVCSVYSVCMCGLMWLYCVLFCVSLCLCARACGRACVRVYCVSFMRSHGFGLCLCSC